MPETTGLEVVEQATPFVSVIIPTRNMRETLKPAIESLFRQSYPKERYEIIVVDNSSNDGTEEMVASLQQDAPCALRFFRKADEGPGSARNLGIMNARGDVIAFTDADCEPAGDWLECMTAAFADAETAGAKGAYLTRQHELVARFVQIEYEDRYDFMLRRMARQNGIDFVDTYAAGYRRELLVASGGFESCFPCASVEDQELSFRLAQQGHKLVFVPGARVYHWGHAHNVPAYWRRKFKIGYWKVLVHRRYPEKMWQDSHTPQVLKAQIVLVGMGGLCLLGSVLWPPLLSGLVLSGLLFLASTLPFVYKAWAKDPPVAIISPGLLLVRALALGTGFAAGLAANRAPGGSNGRDGDR
jgi:glycosyltransferase involved in cell wall biosynthesis